MHLNEHKFSTAADPAADLLRKAQTTCPIKFYCAYKTVKKDGFHMSWTKKNMDPNRYSRIYVQYGKTVQKVSQR